MREDYIPMPGDIQYVPTPDGKAELYEWNGNTWEWHSHLEGSGEQMQAAVAHMHVVWARTVRCPLLRLVEQTMHNWRPEQAG